MIVYKFNLEPLVNPTTAPPPAPSVIPNPSVKLQFTAGQGPSPLASEANTAPIHTWRNFSAHITTTATHGMTS